MISLIDGGLEVTLFTTGPAAPDDRALLAAHGHADRIVEVAPAPLRLSMATPAAPPFEIHASADQLGTFDAIILTADAAQRLLPATARPATARRFGNVFDLDATWVFHLTTPPELAAAQGRWIGEYLRGRYALPPADALDAGLATSRTRTRRPGLHSALADLTRELHAGHARAAAAGYPLPTPTPTA